MQPHNDGDQADSLIREFESGAMSADELGELLATIEGIKEFERQKLKDQFDNLESEETQGTIPIYRSRWFQVAAMIVAVLLPVYLFVPLPGKLGDTPPVLYEQYFNAYPNFEVTVNRSEKTNLSERDYAFFLYDQKDYAEAVVNFKYAIVKNPGDAASKFFLGVSLMITKDHFQAKRQFNAVIEDGNSNYVEAAKWYLALTHLADNKSLQATELFEELASDGYEFKQQSAEILKKID